MPLSDAQPGLFAPWWSETEEAGRAGRHRFIRYRCKRCSLWSDPINAAADPPGSCKKCLELPLAGRETTS